ncbi:hypothetical protein L6452_32089 [Arctium lappa]|uniref:Uncharacterized protein n=1 Tax=Arctium lappa TaxID=4217 RepID=A0ACB8Z7U9_ARCLA|nr:hypothetical protein L6452_32089 [Arctium lappa]
MRTSTCIRIETSIASVELQWTSALWTSTNVDLLCSGQEVDWAYYYFFRYDSLSLSLIRYKIHQNFHPQQIKINPNSASKTNNRDQQVLII